ncbi:DUF4267 domain-containing protein [Nocardia vinacea]|uniref:DUF4267 domain-containing protein n=1 Tax=Nocardia vinacea TaxID=96468 RepID=UPI00031D75F3|nr:DUF4267 domain-containing protein [Nocardia vinacea]
MQDEKLTRSAIIVNAVGASVAVAFSVAALVDPTLAITSSADSPGVDLYAQAYAARAIPLGAALLFSLTSRRKRALLPLLTVSGAVQLGDVAIGATQGVPGMMVGGSVLALIHLATAGQLALGRSRSATAAA